MDNKENKKLAKKQSKKEEKKEQKVILTEEEKLEAKRKYRREYMAKRRAEDPDFRQKQLDIGKKSRQRPEALEKERIRNK